MPKITLTKCFLTRCVFPRPNWTSDSQRKNRERDGQLPPGDADRDLVASGKGAEETLSLKKPKVPNLGSNRVLVLSHQDWLAPSCVRSPCSPERPAVPPPRCFMASCSFIWSTRHQAGSKPSTLLAGPCGRPSPAPDRKGHDADLRIPEPPGHRRPPSCWWGGAPRRPAAVTAAAFGFCCCCFGAMRRGTRRCCPRGAFRAARLGGWEGGWCGFGCIHSFNRHLLSTYCVPDAVLGNREIDKQPTGKFIQGPSRDQGEKNNEENKSGY